MKTARLNRRYEDLMEIIRRKDANLYQCKIHLRKASLNDKDMLAQKNISGGHRLYDYDFITGEETWHQVGKRDIYVHYDKGPAYVFMDFFDLCRFTGLGLKIVLNDFENVSKAAGYLINSKPDMVYFIRQQDRESGLYEESHMEAELFTQIEGKMIFDYMVPKRNQSPVEANKREYEPSFRPQLKI